ncbi:MAG: EAL domain-containing protein [Pseudomonadota bacterium]
MSMYRQLWLAIIVSMLFALGASLLASTLGARNYLESQLSIKNSDNAQALALSLSQNKPDAVLVELAVSALFDGGHYEFIRVVDPMGKVIVERHAAPGVFDAPTWFVRLLPIKPMRGQAQISDGWKQVGLVTLASHARFAYGALWEIVYRMIFALMGAGLLGGYLGSLILRRLRRPLAAVIAQAQAITERRCMTIEEPAVPELKQLASAMNATVHRLKFMFDEEAARLDTIRREAHFDGLSGLMRRPHLIACANECLRGEQAVLSGVLVLLRIAALADVNRQHGRASTDTLISHLGAALNKLVEQHVGWQAGRLNGADFVVFAPGENDAEPLAVQIHQVLQAVAEQLLPGGVFLPTAATSFCAGELFSEILSRADFALLRAEASPLHSVQVNLPTSSGASTDSQAWAQQIRTALLQQRLMLGSFPVLNNAGKLLHRECPARIQIEADGAWLNAAQIMPWAVKMGIVQQIDLQAIDQALLRLEQEEAEVGINLSLVSLREPSFVPQVIKRLQAAPELSKRLWLEFPEAEVFRHLSAFRSFCQKIQPLGCKIGIEHAGHQIAHISKIYDLGLHYVKIDASIIRGIEQNAANQVFVRGVCLVTHSIGLVTLAEGVNTLEELAYLPTLGIDGCTGTAVR